MEFSKDNIVSKRFSKKWLGGLSEFEVRDFLHVLAEEIRHLSQMNLLQKKQIQDQESLLKDYRDREHILKESIQSAEKWAEKIRKDAEKNSSLVLEKAQNKSESLIHEARHSLQTVYNDILDLKRIQLQFKTGLKAALQVQMDLLDQDPVLQSDSLLATKNVDHLPERKPEEQGSDPVETGPPSKQEDSQEGQENLQTSRKNPMDQLKMDNSELQSLKESLSGLDKTFS